MKAFIPNILLSLCLAYLTACSSSPTHSSLKHNNWKENLLSIHEVKLNSNFTHSHKISPDGKKLSWIGYEGADPHIFVKEIDTGKLYKFKYFGDPNYLWSSASDSLIITKANDGNITNRYDFLFFDESGLHLKPFLPADDYFKAYLGEPRNDSQKMMFAFYAMKNSSLYPDLYAVNSNTGVKTKIASNDGATITWIYDEDGKVVATLDKNIDSYEIRLVKDDVKNKPLASCKSERHLSYIGYADQKIYLLTNCFTDLQKLVSIDTRSEKINVENIGSEVDIDDVLTDIKTGLPVLASSYPGYQQNFPLQTKVEDLLGSFSGEKNIKIISHTPDFSKVLLQTASIQYKNVYLYSALDRSKTLLSSTPLAQEHLIVDGGPIKIIGRYQSPIYSFLSLPKLNQTKNLPLVVLIHGGAESRDYYEYNSDVIFLASRGYAVLQVNYSGSTGYGLGYQRAGFKNVQRMKDDIEDAINWTVDNHIADGGNIVLMGGSFGGYLALLIQQSNGLSVQPKGVISINAPTDILKLTSESSIPFDETDGAHYFGKVEELLENKDVIPSPINCPVSSGKNILLIHSELDKIVNVSHARDFMEKFSNKNNIRAVFLKDDSHNIDIWYNNLTVYREVEKFLAKNIGGPDKGFDYYYFGRLLY